jgi:curved DNA-binding protein CbpA
MTKSLYAILNVAPDADPAVVEAAYKALMKKYHPDVHTDNPGTARRLAAEINDAFHILRDPAKRAEYDMTERVRAEGARRSAGLAEGARAYQPPPMPQTRRRRSKWPALFMIAAAALAVLFIWRGSDAALGWDAAVPPIRLSAAASAPARLEPVSPGDVDRAVAEFKKIKERSGLIGLSAFSHDCFAAQSQSDKAADFDFCVAFDKAAMTYGVNLPGHSYLPQLPRFEPAEIGRRHALAGRLLSNDGGLIEARIDQVGILTSDRLRALTPQVPAAEEKAPQITNAVAVRQPRAAPPRYTQRLRKRRPNAPPQRDPDFLEREGYIY